VSIRLNKIARDLRASVADIAGFLRSNGFETEEDPNEILSDEIAELIRNNYTAYLVDRSRNSGNKPTAFKPETNGSEYLPVELKIIEAASREKKLIERIIGFTEFQWNFTVAKYKGECSQPIDFTVFDQVICDLLLVEKMPIEKIGSILGLDIINDPAEREILTTGLKALKDDKMVDGDDNLLFLSPTGISYAQQGVKYSTFSRKFELYFDTSFGSTNDIKNIFSNLESERVDASVTRLPNSLAAIQNLAEFQAPEIHFPAKNYLLQKVEFVGAESYSAKVWVILLENFRDNSIRTLVYDERQNKVLDILSEILDQQEPVKLKLLDQLIKLDEAIEYTQEEKKEDQIKIEQDLIEKQHEIDEAIDAQDVEKIKTIESEIFQIRRHFNSLEFEVELKRLFDETAEELWIISPWIKKATNYRIPFFEKYLKKGGKIFVAYSEPEQPGQEMALEPQLNKLLELEKKYQHFYLHQLPPFHYKNVWLRNTAENDLYYTGSYNILSFFVSQGLTHVRQEKMTRLDWDAEIQEQYLDVIARFGIKYINKAIEDLNTMCAGAPKAIDKAFLQRLKTLDNSKLLPFLNSGIDRFDEAYKELEKAKEENVNYFRRHYFEAQMESFSKRIQDLKGPIEFKLKKNWQTEYEQLRNEFMDFMDIQMGRAQEVAKAIDSLKTIPFNVKRK